jgi:hypothetical protein
LVEITYEITENYRVNPVLPLRLEDAVDIMAIVDSGAEYSIFMAEHLLPLGIKLLDGHRERVESINSTFEVYKHKVSIIVFDEMKIELSIGFSDSIKRNLLGRDFLNNVQFGLRENHQLMFFKLEP